MTSNERISGTEWMWIVACGFFLVFFVGLAVRINSLTNQNIFLAGEIQQIKEKHKTETDFLSSGIEENYVAGIALRQWQIKLQSQTQVLEASLDSQEMRWARIKKVREAIRDNQYAGLTISQMTDIAAAIVDMSEQNDVSIPLILAVMRQESAFNIRIESHAGALGLMQVMPNTAKDIAMELNKRRYHLFNLRHNVEFGSYYLWKMLDTFDGNEELAVKAYNAGPVFVQKVVSGELKRKFECKWDDGTTTVEDYYCETADYGRKVLKYKEEFDKLGI